MKGFAEATHHMASSQKYIKQLVRSQALMARAITKEGILSNIQQIPQNLLKYSSTGIKVNNE